MRGLLVMVVVLAACGGDDDGGPLSPGEAEALCDDFCTECRADVAGCQSDCSAELSESCNNGDAIRVVFECFLDNGCNLDDSSCDDRVSPTDAHERWAEACRDRLAECGESSDEIASECDLDDVKYYSSGWADDARRCFEEDCAAIEACLEASRDSC
jgi:hypothetical protein